MTDNNGNIITKRGNNGYSSLYPSSWSQEKINQEVKSALKNIIIENNEKNYYVGLSDSGIKIQFVIINKKIISHYPLAK